MAVRVYHCHRCGYEWAGRGEREPKYCASDKCHSKYWKMKREAYA